MDPHTAEAGEAYLNSMGFRSLIEWMTAECLLSRPDDPLMFIRSILDEKLSEVRLKDPPKIVVEGLNVCHSICLETTHREVSSGTRTVLH